MKENPADIPEWARQEIISTWNFARNSESQLSAFRFIERMVDRLGYGRIGDNNPSLYQDVREKR